MVVAAENIPKSKAETIFAKFQDAAIQSNGAGRPFLSLCSLIDLRLTGKISKEELIHIGKMMDIEMSLVDLEAMLEMIPSVIVGKASINAGAKIIDYRVLNNALQNFTPRDLDSRMPNYSMTTTMSTTGLLAHALPAYATPGVTHIPSNSVDPMMFSKSINTPLGIAINSPMRRFDQAAGFGSPLPGGPASSSSSAYEKIAKTLIDRVRLAIDERSRSWNINFSLRKKLDTLDTSDSGLISMRSLQVALEEIGIVLTTSEFHAVMSLYGRPDDDRIFYDSFCRTIDNQSNIRDRDREPSRESKDNAPSKSSGKEPYLTSRVMQRLKELKNDGRNPLSIFEVHDLDHTGLVSSVRVTVKIVDPGLMLLI
jgi:Ca2+-binding EF-hand superfamily protein